MSNIKQKHFKTAYIVKKSNIYER